MKLVSKFILFISVCSFLTLSTSCEPETIIETEVITINDTLIVNTIDTVFISLTDTLFIPDEAKITNFILVKHAEKGTIGNDPNLTTEGLERAEKLANILSELKLNRVYSTDYNRTIQTAIPTADNQGLNISVYGGFDHNTVINDILNTENEGKVLIVGHSNTVPNFLNALTGTSNYSDLADDSFDNLYIVNAKATGDSEVIHLKY